MKELITYRWIIIRIPSILYALLVFTLGDFDFYLTHRTGNQNNSLHIKMRHIQSPVNRYNMFVHFHIENVLKSGQTNKIDLDQLETIFKKR